MSLAQQILLQIILIAINAFFAATEIAVVSLNTTKLKKMAEDGDKYAPKLLKMAENPTSFLSTIQIGITLAGFLGSAFAADNLAVYIRPLFEKIGLPTGVSGTISGISAAFPGISGMIPGTSAAFPDISGMITGTASGAVSETAATRSGASASASGTV